MIAEVMEKVGKDGVITVEESKGLKFETEFVEGMSIDRGYVSPYFVTNADRMEASLDEPYILITDKKISAVGDILPVLEKVLQVTKNFVIVCDDCDGGRSPRSSSTSCAARSTRSSSRRRASATAARRCSKTSLSHRRLVRHRGDGRQAENAQVGRPRPRPPRHVHEGRDDDHRGHGTDKAIRGRIKQIKAQTDEATSEFDREKLQERLAKLAGGVAVIKVGASTEVELKRRSSTSRTRSRRPARPSKRASSPAAASRCCAPSPPSSRPRRSSWATSAPAPPSWSARSRSPSGSSPRTPARRARSSSRTSATARARCSATTPAGRLLRPAEGRHHRPGEGDALRARERRQHRGDGADDGNAGDRDPGGSQRRPGAAADGLLGSSQFTVRSE